MIKNTYISLDPKGPPRKDAINSIRYTLCLNNHLPELDSNKDLIPKLMEACQKCCEGLFGDDSKYITYNFFGKNYSDKTPFTVLDFSDPTLSFSQMILQHCVLSSYHSLVSDILEETDKGGIAMTGYYITNQVKERGINTLINNKTISVESGKLNCKKLKSVNGLNTKKSAKSSDFNKRSNTHCKNIPFVKDLFIKETENSSAIPGSAKEVKFYIQFAGLYTTICSVKAAQWRGFFHNPKGREVTTLLKRLYDIPVELNKQMESAGKNRVDQLYHRYLVERIFNFDLFNCLIQNIRKVEDNTNYRLNSSDILAILCKCKNLQNSFSRQYFIQYAFEKFFVKPNSSEDFWYEHRSHKSNELVSSTVGLSEGFQMTTWLHQFSFFCDYMSSFIIPIFEWCFVDMLLRHVEREDPDGLHISHLYRAIEILSDYIKENYTSLLDAGIKNKKEDQNQNKNKAMNPKYIIKPKNLDYLKTEPYLETLFMIFFQENKDRSINMTLLNPDYFTKADRDLYETYSSRIRNFYIELIKDKYLTPSL